MIPLAYHQPWKSYAVRGLQRWTSAHPAPSSAPPRAGRRLLKWIVYYVLAGGLSGGLSLQSGFWIPGHQHRINPISISAGRKNHLTHHGIFSTQWHNLLAIRRASHVQFYVNGQMVGCISASTFGTCTIALNGVQPSVATSTYEGSAPKTARRLRWLPRK